MEASAAKINNDNGGGRAEAATATATARQVKWQVSNNIKCGVAGFAWRWRRRREVDEKMMETGKEASAVTEVAWASLGGGGGNNQRR